MTAELEKPEKDHFKTPEEKRKKIEDLIKNGFYIPRNLLDIYQDTLGLFKRTKGLTLETLEDINGKPFVKIKINFPSTGEFENYQSNMAKRLESIRKRKTKNK